MQNTDASRTAFEAMVQRAVADNPGVSFTDLEIRPYRNSSAIRAVATFKGPSDSDTVLTVSEDLCDIIMAGNPGDWVFADRIEFSSAVNGFMLSIDFNTTPATADA